MEENKKHRPIKVYEDGTPEVKFIHFKTAQFVSDEYDPEVFIHVLAEAEDFRTVYNDIVAGTFPKTPERHEAWMANYIVRSAYNGNTKLFVCVDSQTVRVVEYDESTTDYKVSNIAYQDFCNNVLAMFENE